MRINININIMSSNIIYYIINIYMRLFIMYIHIYKYMRIYIMYIHLYISGNNLSGSHRNLAIHYFAFAIYYYVFQNHSTICVAFFANQ